MKLSRTYNELDDIIATFMASLINDLEKHDITSVWFIAAFGTAVSMQSTYRDLMFQTGVWFAPDNGIQVGIYSNLIDTRGHAFHVGFADPAYIEKFINFIITFPKGG